MKRTEWVDKELATVELGDKRLNERAKQIVDDLQKNPSGSIPQISNGWSATKSAYDFFANDQVEYPALIKAERQATLSRIQQETLVLAVQDTTEINLTQYPTIKGQGWLSRNNHTGFFVHSTLCVSSSGVPMGLLDQSCWVRTEKADPKLKRQRHTQRTIEEKESYKWLQALKRVSSACPASTTLLFVSDAESDIHDYFACERPAHVDVLVRACQNRRLVDSEQLLWPTLRQTPAAGTVKIEVTAQAGRPARAALCQVHYRRVTLRPSNSNRAAHLPRLAPVTVSAVLIEERNPPAGQKPLCWLLLTTRTVASWEDALQIITFYTLRWRVERFHFVLKSGCRIEERRLQSVSALCRFLALANIVAWRLLWLTYLARVQPEAPCTLALQTDEWQALYLLTHDKPSTATIPTPSLQEAVLWLARLGGYLARSADGPPGVRVLWRGWITLLPAVRLLDHFT